MATRRKEKRGKGTNAPNAKLPDHKQVTANLISDDASEFDDDWFEEHNRLVKACAQKIISCFKNVSHQLDLYEAWQLFDAFSRRVRPKKKKGPHGPRNPKFDAALIKAHKEASAGKKMVAIHAVGAEYQKSVEATERHWQRIRDAERQEASLKKEIAKWFGQLRHK